MMVAFTKPAADRNTAIETSTSPEGPKVARDKAAAASVGLATPLLPCGPLYFIFSLALLSGSALRGAETLLAFGLGTVPLLWFAQTNYRWLQVKLGPTRLARAQAIFALTVAAILVWRLRGTLGLAGPGSTDFVCF